MEVVSVKEILEQYTAHGWRLRKVLATDPKEADGLKLPDEVTVEESSLNALWFSRRSRPGAETWELRRTQGSPFALLTSVPDSSSDLELQSILAETEERMWSRND